MAIPFLTAVAPVELVIVVAPCTAVVAAATAVPAICGAVAVISVAVATMAISPGMVAVVSTVGIAHSATAHVSPPVSTASAVAPSLAPV